MQFLVISAWKKYANSIQRILMYVHVSLCIIIVTVTVYIYVYYMYIYICMYYYILYSCELLRLLIDFIYVLMLINQPSGDTWLPHDGRGLIRPWEEPVDGAAIHQGREHSHAHPR